MTEEMNVATQLATLRGEMREAVATLAGGQEVLRGQVAGLSSQVNNKLDAQNAQVMQGNELLREIIKSQSAAILDLQKVVTADREAARAEVSAVRVSLESRDREIKVEAGVRAQELEDRVDATEKRLDRQDGLIKGLAVVAAFISPVVTGLALRAFS